MLFLSQYSGVLTPNTVAFSSNIVGEFSGAGSMVPARLGWAEEAPGFAVGVVEAGSGVGAAAEQEAGASEGGAERDDVPGGFGDDVDGEEMDFAGEVREGASLGAAVGVDAVEAFAELGGTLDLDAPEGRRRVGRERRRAGRIFGGGLGEVVCGFGFSGVSAFFFWEGRRARAPAPHSRGPHLLAPCLLVPCLPVPCLPVPHWT